MTTASPAATPIPVKRRMVPLGDLLLALGMGTILLAFGWLDTKHYFANRSKPPVTFVFDALPGGEQMSATEEWFHHRSGANVILHNFSPLEFAEHHAYRHGLGPTSTLEIHSKGNVAKLRFRFENEIPDQEITVACDNKVVEQISHLAPGELSRSYPLKLRPDASTITFTYRRYNHDGTRTLDDPRYIAGTFGSLDLYLP